MPIIVGDRQTDLDRCFPPPQQFDGEVLLVSRADLSDLPPVRAFKTFIAPRMTLLGARLLIATDYVGGERKAGPIYFRRFRWRNVRFGSKADIRFSWR